MKMTLSKTILYTTGFLMAWLIVKLTLITFMPCLFFAKQIVEKLFS